MSAKSWIAIVTERNSFLDVEYCDDATQLEFLRRYRSEPDLAACWRHRNGVCKSKSLTMVNQFVEMPQKVSDDKASSNAVELQRDSEKPGWHLHECEDEGIDFFSNDLSPMENLLKDCRRSGDEKAIRVTSDLVPMENLLEDSNLPSKKSSRPSKAQRMRYQVVTEKMVRLLRNDPDEFELDEMSLPPSLAMDSRRKTRLATYLQSEKERVLKDREIDRILAPLLVGQRL